MKVLIPEGAVLVSALPVATSLGEYKPRDEGTVNAPRLQIACDMV